MGAPDDANNSESDDPPFQDLRLHLRPDALPLSGQVVPDIGLIDHAVVRAVHLSLLCPPNWLRGLTAVRLLPA